MEDLREVATADELRMALEIRERVFVVEQAIPLSADRDGKDDRARHALLLVDGLPAATGRLFLEPRGQARLERIAVLPSYRGRGYGRRIIYFLEHMARQGGALEAGLSPHQHLATYYKGLGYEQVPGTERVGAHTLIRMQKRLYSGGQ